MLWQEADYWIARVWEDGALVGGGGLPEHQLNAQHHNDEDAELDAQMAILQEAHAALTPEAKKEAITKFWSTVELEVTAVEDDVKMIFLQNHKIRQCDCAVDCGICICNTTGDLFWVCNDRTCTFVSLCQERPTLAELDVEEKFDEQNCVVKMIKIVSEIIFFVKFRLKSTQNLDFVLGGPVCGDGS